MAYGPVVTNSRVVSKTPVVPRPTEMTNRITHSLAETKNEARVVSSSLEFNLFFFLIF
jgi:hypothetical protein